MPLKVIRDNEQVKFLKQISTSDHVILLDENGRTYNSKQFAGSLQKVMNSGVKTLVYVIGGAYGFSTELKDKYRSVRLSDLTLSHHLARLVLVEQLYRACTIINNEPYHNE